jgi:hypothetical protein
MKQLNVLFYNARMIFVFGIGLIPSLKAQTTLVAGDLAFSGYKCNDAVADQFSFVLLKNIASGTVIRFTDYGWRTNIAPGPQFTNSGITESEILFTATTALVAGQEITIVGTTVTIVNPASGSGTAVYTVGANFLVGNLSLASNGDQILAYQGTFASPVFIAGIHMNVNTGVPSTTTTTAWDGVLAVIDQNNNNSELPPGLITGTNANWFATEQDNVKFLCGSTPINTVALARAALNSANSLPANWTANNTNPSGFTLPSACGYLQPTAPVKLISFTGQSNPDKSATLQWKVDEQVGIREYKIERSTKGINFNQIGVLTANSLPSLIYTFNDPQLPDNNNFYRLGIVEQSGALSYSNIISIHFKRNRQIDFFPNPVTRYSYHSAIRRPGNPIGSNHQ